MVVGLLVGKTCWQKKKNPPGETGQCDQIMSVEVNSLFIPFTTEVLLGTSQRRGRSSKNKAGVGLPSNFPKYYTRVLLGPLLRRNWSIPFKTALQTHCQGLKGNSVISSSPSSLRWDHWPRLNYLQSHFTLCRSHFSQGNSFSLLETKRNPAFGSSKPKACQVQS